MSRIDIIIPVFNQAHKIKRCLDSIFKQTFKDFSIVVVNDRSTDNLIEVLQSYHPKIRVINQNHAGANTARNHGAAFSKAPFIIFCDADIVMRPQMLKTMYETLNSHPNSAYAYSSFRFGLKTFKLWPFDPGKLKTMPYIHTTSLIRRECFLGFDPHIKRFQDWDLWLSLMEKGYTGVFIPRILFQVQTGGTMSSWVPKFFFKFFKKHKRVREYNYFAEIIRKKHHLN